MVSVLKKKNLLGYDLDALNALMVELGGKPFHARQLLKWMHARGVSDFDVMTDLSKVFSLVLSVSDKFESFSSFMCRSDFKITDFDTIAPISKMKTKSNPAIKSAYDIQKLLSAFVLSFLNIFLLFLLL